MTYPDAFGPAMGPPDAPDVTPAEVPDVLRPSGRDRAINLLAQYNPFYFLSACCMLLGIFVLNNSLTWSPLPQHNLLVLIATLNAYLYEELGFSGNREHYDDPRNSFLNEVLDRRLGIPISLAAVYLEIGRRAGLRLEGVNFPGHFLVRAPAGPGDMEDLIVDPFHAGALLSEVHCRHLLRQHVGEEAAFEHGLLATATRQHIVVRTLVNLKRLYVRMRSFPQARAISDLLLAVDPSALAELRDRGLLAYHMEDFAAALKDLEAYLRLMPRGDAGDPGHDHDPDVSAHGEDGDEPQASESAQIWEHVKTLRRRVAGFN